MEAILDNLSEPVGLILVYIIFLSVCYVHCVSIYFSDLESVLPLHIEDIELSYQSLVYAAVMQRMNGIISIFFLAIFTSHKKRNFFPYFLNLCSILHSTPQYCMYCTHTDVKIVCVRKTTIFD